MMVPIWQQNSDAALNKQTPAAHSPGVCFLRPAMRGAFYPAADSGASCDHGVARAPAYSVVGSAGFECALPWSVLDQVGS